MGVLLVQWGSYYGGPVSTVGSILWESCWYSGVRFMGVMLVQWCPFYGVLLVQWGPFYGGSC